MTNGSNPRFGDLTDDLIDLLGDDDFLHLVEIAGGTRLMIPFSATAGKFEDRVSGLSEQARQNLRERYFGNVLRIPLAREWRAVRYADHGLSNTAIALKLGITETAVDKLFKRLGGKPAPRSEAA